MAEDSGYIGFGTALGWADTQNGEYTYVVEITDVTLPGIEVNDVDVTHHSLADLFRDFTPGLGTAGEIEFKILFDKTAQAILYALLRTSKWWQAAFPLAEGEVSPSNWKCLGYLKSIQNMNPIDDKMEATLKVKLRRKPVFTAGS